MKKMMYLAALAISITVVRAETPAFEAASVKPNKSLEGSSSIKVTQGRLVMQRVSLQKMILNAYGIPDDRSYALIGPGWLATDDFDLEATFPPDTGPAQLRPMLQRLLTERFQLALHKENRQLPMFSLVVARGGPKIVKSDDGQGKTSGGPGRLEASKITMRKLADLLSRMQRLPVRDDTGLEGAYDFTLTWTPDDAARAVPGDAASDAAGSGPSLFTALQEQLGLKLESGKGPTDVLVIDHIEKTPSGN